MDEAVTEFINSAAGMNPALDTLMRGVTYIGVPLMVLLCAVQWWSGRDRLHLRHILVAAGLSSIAGLAVNQIILLFVHRTRPYDAGTTHLIVPPSADWSFPSDHATMAFAIVATFVLHAERRQAAVFAIVALLVSWSRIYVGTHYFGDILGGVVTGVIGGLLVRWLYPEGSRLDRLLTNLL